MYSNKEFKFQGHVLEPGTPEHRNTGTPDHSGTPRKTEFDGVVLFSHYRPFKLVVSIGK